LRSPWGGGSGGDFRSLACPCFPQAQRCGHPGCDDGVTSPFALWTLAFDRYKDIFISVGERMAELAELVGVLKAAGESTRLRLLRLLADGDHTVKDLTEILRQSQPRVSRHLKLLADAGLVERHAEGAWAYYGLARRGAAGDLARQLIDSLDSREPELMRDRERQLAVREAHQRQAAEY